jgi:hypothetical protein
LSDLFDHGHVVVGIVQWRTLQKQNCNQEKRASHDQSLSRTSKVLHYYRYDIRFTKKILMKENFSLRIYEMIYLDKINLNL